MTLAWDMAHWAWPQWTYIVLIGLNIVIAAFLDGKPKNQNYSFALAVLAGATSLFVLASGGFYA